MYAYIYIEKIMKIAAHVDYYLSPMIPAEPSSSLENLLCCICGLTNKIVLRIKMYIIICMHHKISGGVARTLRYAYGQKLYFVMLLKQYFDTDIIISTYEYNKMSKK